LPVRTGEFKYFNNPYFTSIKFMIKASIRDGTNHFNSVFAYHVVYLE